MNRTEHPMRAKRQFFVRVPRGADLVEYLTALAARKRIRCGAVSVIGATHVATIGTFDQRRLAYVKKTFRGEMEIVSCTGNVSVKDGKPFLHLHAVLGDTKLRCYGGHLFPGSKVFSAEAHIVELSGARVREPDPETGLSLWRR